MKNNKLIYGLWILFFLLILFAYRNHFDNGFHFDDGHTIQNNVYIRSLDNIPDFFIVGAPTFSTLPANQLYRPVVTTTLAFDYWLSSKLDINGDGYNPFYYHLSMFIEYLVMLILIYLLVIKIFDKTIKSNNNKWFAFGTTIWFGIHVTNGETLNYIISRSDLLSTLFVILAFIIFIYWPSKRKFGFFMIPFFLGLLTKQTAAVFIPILIVYFLFFEMDSYLKESQSNVEKKRKIRTLLVQTVVIFIITAFSIYFILSKQGESYTPGGSSVLLYMATQPFVILHYFISFFFPYSLSADSDWFLLGSVWDVRFFIGSAFVITMFWIAFRTYKIPKTRPVSFGILWFFIALAPTSSIIPLAEVMNDHRMMYPFVGLVIAIVWSLVLLFFNYEQRIRNSYVIKNSIVTVLALVFIFHFFAIMKRVEVWDNGKTLWYDVTVKSPKNGRGLMNYGLQLASEGKYNQALNYYNRALELMPYYSYLFTNMAIAYNAIDSVEKAESLYRRSIELSPNSHNGYYYYAIFLRSKGKMTEAESNFKKVVELSPDFIFARYALLEIYNNDARWTEMKTLLDETANKFPYDQTVIYYQKLFAERNAEFNDLVKKASSTKNPDDLLKISLIYYKQGNYDSCAIVSEEIIKIDNKNLNGYNNLIASLNQLGKYDEAIEVGSEALKIEKNNQLLNNNLAVSIHRKSLTEKLLNLNSESELITLSLDFYREEMYLQCIKACRKLLKYKPDNPIAYNNICSAYNALGKWKLAKEAGELAVKFDPESELAKNNLAVAIRNLKE